MNRTLTILLLLTLHLTAQHQTPTEERYILAKDKQTFLKTLTPGTPDHIFYHALEAQKQNNRPTFQKFIQAWKDNRQNFDNNQEIRFQQLTNRQAILDFESGTPDQKQDALNSLQDILQLDLNHTSPQTTQEKTTPTTLNQNQITQEKFLTPQRNQTDLEQLQKNTHAHILKLIAQNKNWSPEINNHLAKIITRADIPALYPIILKALKEKNGPDFSQIAARQNLSLTQLKSLAKDHPPLNSNTAFVNEILTRLQTDAPILLERNPTQKIAHLQQLHNFTATLPPSQNSLKAHTLYHLLKTTAQQNQYNLENFLQYLALPRSTATIIFPKHEKTPPHAISLNTNYPTRLPAINNETDLIQTQLNHFLTDPAAPQKIAPYLNSKYLKKRTAIAQLLAGKSQTTEDLSPTEYQALREKTSLTITPATPTTWNPTDQVSLKLNTKNVPTLSLSIYQLDTLAYAKKFNREIPATIDLSALTPHITRNIKTNNNPFLNQNLTVPIPELTGPGTWLIQLQGKGHRATALIHKGDLQLTSRDTGTAQEILITDFDGTPLPNIQAIIDNKTLTTSPEGTITLPYATYPTQTKIILYLPNQNQNSGLTRILPFTRLAASKSLHISTLTHPGQFLSNTTATIYLKSTLIINNHPATKNYLTDSKLTLDAILEDGTTIRVAENTKPTLSSHDFIPLTFNVPENLKSLEAKLTSTIVPPHVPEKTTLTATQIIQADTTSASSKNLAHAYFSPSPEGWNLSLLGRNGEPWPDKELTITLHHKNIKSSKTLYLKTNPKGIINLGKLPNITLLKLESGQDHPAATLNLHTQKHLTAPTQFPANTPATIHLENAPSLTPLNYQLTALSNQKQNHFKNLTLQANTLTLTNLPTGEYRLTITGHTPHTLTILPTTKTSHWATTKGKAIELDTTPSTTISSAKIENNRINIQLKNPTQYTRVHLVASRFSDTTTPIRPATPINPSPATTTFGHHPSITINGATLSTEHQYILNRRSQAPRLGNMLPRPSFHLQPWETEKTELTQETNLGEAAGSSGAIPFSSRKSKPSPKPSAPSSALNSEAPLDFLAHPTTILTNLKPAPQGKLSINLNRFNNQTRLDIIVTQETTATSTQIPLPSNPLTTRDLRPTKTLDTSKHFKARHTKAILQKGKTATIENILDADWKAYTSLAQVWSYFQTHTQNHESRENFNRLAPITNWPKLTQEQRMELLQSAGSFELHLFIKHRDPAWFKKHLTPLLENKRRKLFIDHYLLDHDLTPYLELTKYQNLNTIEKALLAHKLPGKNKPILDHLNALYQATNPTPEEDTALFTSLLKQNHQDAQAFIPSASRAYVVNVLDRIIIPVVDFKNVTVEEAIDFLRQRSRELDNTELDPSKQGIGFIVRTPTSVGASPSSGGAFGGDKGISRARIDSLQMRNVPLSVALDQVCKKADLRYRIENGKVVILPAHDIDDAELFTRTFPVPPDFLTLLDDGGNGSAGSDDPFADSSTTDRLQTRPNVKELLERSGITMPEGASATFDQKTGKLTIRNTATNHDLVDQMTMSLKDQSPRERFAGEKRAYAPKKEKVIGSAADEVRYKIDDKPSNRPLYDPTTNPLETKAYLEANYLHRRTTEGTPKVKPNRFWLDLAAWDGTSPFLSPHFADCRANIHEALIALAFLDLAFEAAQPDAESNKNNLRITAKQPTILFYRDTIATPPPAAPSSLLASLRYFRDGDQYTIDENGKRRENPVTTEFQTLTTYTADLVITNPTGIEREIEILRQVPAGAIRLDSAENLIPITTTIRPHGSYTSSISFYFPLPGTFTHYAPQIHEDKKLAIGIPANTLKAVPTLELKASNTWAHIIATGTHQEILTALATFPLNTIELYYLDYFLNDPTFYKKASEILAKRMVTHPTTLHYAYLHRDLKNITTHLANPEVTLNLFGSYFKSKTTNINPYTGTVFQDTEWRPLIIPRAFELKDNRHVPQIATWDDYRTLLDHLVWKNNLTTEEKLTLTYHLFLHERPDLAIELLSTCPRQDTEAKMQWDYLTAYAAFYQSNPQKAQTIAKTWLNKSTPEWNNRFQTIIEQANQIQTTQLLKPKQPTTKTPNKPFWKANLTADNNLQIEHQNLTHLDLKIYSIDLELLFSNNPFTQLQNQFTNTVAPSQTIRINLPKDKNKTTHPLPKELTTGNRLITIETKNNAWSTTLQSSTLEINEDKIQGILQVTANNKPLPKTYIKIYAETQNGQIIFYKDGHTDLRGIFNYRDHNQHPPSKIKRYAIFTHHNQQGTKTIIIE